jgi:hypothetical protein
VFRQLLNTFNGCLDVYREWMRDAIHAALQDALQEADPGPTAPLATAATQFDPAIQARIAAGPRPVLAAPGGASPPPAVCDHPDHGMSCADGDCA